MYSSETSARSIVRKIQPVRMPGCERVLQRLRTNAALEQDMGVDDLSVDLARSPWRRWIAVTALGVALLFISIAVFRRRAQG